MLDSIAHFIQGLIRDIEYPGLFLLIVLESTLVPIPSLLVPLGAGDTSENPQCTFANTVSDVAVQAGSGAVICFQVLSADIAKYSKIDVIVSDFGPSLVGALPEFTKSGRTIPALATSDGNVIAGNSIEENVTDVLDNGSGNCWRNNHFTTGSVPPCP